MRLALVLVLIPALVGCHDLNAVATTKLDERVPIDAPGVYVHPGSGIAFPKEAAGFTRNPPDRYDREGNDVGVHYRKIHVDSAALFRSEVTLFVYPSKRTADGRPMPLDDQFELEAAAIRHKHDDVREVRRVDSDAARGGAGVHVRAAEFTYRGGEKLGSQTMVTILVAFLDEPWHVTYRADFPPQRRDECLAGVEELLAALGLPPTGLPPWEAAAPRK